MRNAARVFVVVGASALILVGYQNCSAGFTPIDLGSTAAAGTDAGAGPLSLFGSKTLVASQLMAIYQSTKQYSDPPFGPCSLALDGSLNVGFGATARFNSSFVGDPTGITAEWAGSDINAANGDNETVIDNTPVTVTASARQVRLVNADTINNDTNRVGTYTRFLEYRRNGEVICTTNMVMFQLLGQTTTADTVTPDFACNSWTKLQAGETLSKTVSIDSGDSLYCETNFDSSLTAQITNLDTGLTNSIGAYALDTMYTNGWVQGRKIDGTIGLIFLGAVSHRSTVAHFRETVGTESVDITVNAGADPGTGLCTNAGFYLLNGGGESYCGERREDRKQVHVDFRIDLDVDFASGCIGAGAVGDFNKRTVTFEFKIFYRDRAVFCCATAGRNCRRARRFQKRFRSILVTASTARRISIRR